MQKLLFLSIIAFMVGIFALSPHSASAHEVSAKNLQSVQRSTQRAVPAASCMYDACDGLSPIKTHCADGAVVEQTSHFNVHGEGVVKLVFSPSCHAAWGFIKFTKAMPRGHVGHAQIDRKPDDASQVCEGSGGNGNVKPGEHSCYSGMLGDGPTESATACGFFDDERLVCTQSF